MYKSTNSLAPEYLSELFVKNSVLSTLRLKNNEADLLVPLFKTSNGQKSIRHFVGLSFLEPITLRCRNCTLPSYLQKEAKKLIVEGCIGLSYLLFD